jgi:hypothetical protein
MLARFSDNKQPIASSSTPVEIQRTPLPSVEVRRALPVVEVRRALPTALRALPVNSAPSVAPTVGWKSNRMLDGRVILVHYQGELPSSAALPPRGRFIGEEYSTGNTSWIWMTPVGASFHPGSIREL